MHRGPLEDINDYYSDPTDGHSMGGLLSLMAVLGSEKNVADFLILEVTKQKNFTKSKNGFSPPQSKFILLWGRGG